MTRLALASVLACTITLACATRPNPDLAPEPDDRSLAASLDTSSRLDALMRDQWKVAGIEPSPTTTDAEYLRRVSLDLLGRVPTLEEVEAFLADQSPTKRAALVDRLLASEAFAEHWAGLYADLLLPGEPKAERLARPPLERSLAAALHEGRAWSDVATELLAGEGSLADQPELAFLAARARGQTSPERLGELASTSARVFLGSRIECAQCHDHPYVDFSQQDFWATTAYFGRVRFDLDRATKPPKVEVHERVRGELRVAIDELDGGEDIDPRKQAIAPRFMGNDAVAPEPGERQTRRGLLAAEIVEDPRFAVATVGFVWSRLFGRGIIEPWDDLLGRDLATVPPALTLLAEGFVQHDHDLRWLLRTIVLSQTYQRSSTGSGDDRARAAAEAAFARASVRPLAAEPMLASLLVVTGLEQVDNRRFRAIVQAKKQQALREYERVFADDDEMARADGFSGNVPQALLLLNGALTNHAVIVRPGTRLAKILDLPDDEARLRALWRSVYGRDPASDELTWATELVRGRSGEAVWEDLLFAMLQSSEFGSNH